MTAKKQEAHQIQTQVAHHHPTQIPTQVSPKIFHKVGPPLQQVQQIHKQHKPKMLEE